MINIYIYITNTLCGNNWTPKTQPKMPAFSAGIWKTRLKQIQKPAKKLPSVRRNTAHENGPFCQKGTI